ncbi:MAG: exopolysaccharide biosynthesis protein, partial [Acidobacteria bacterium]
MIDIHCHPLPKTDDGARSFEEAVEMLKMAAADGITHLVATPHSNYKYAFRPDENRVKLQELQKAVGESPKLMLGCDFHLHYENIRQLVEDRGSFTINQGDYVLVEFGDQFVPEQMDRVFYEIECAGLIPILTHPERNPVFYRKPELLYRWVSRGCLCQITAKSYTGGFGPEPQQFAERWLAQNLVHFFASDAHDLKFRTPILSECYKKLCETTGEETAKRLLETNPG